MLSSSSSRHWPICHRQTSSKSRANDQEPNLGCQAECVRLQIDWSSDRSMQGGAAARQQVGPNMPRYVGQGVSTTRGGRNKSGVVANFAFGLARAAPSSPSTAFGKAADALQTVSKDTKTGTVAPEEVLEEEKTWMRCSGA